MVLHEYLPAVSRRVAAVAGIATLLAIGSSTRAQQPPQSQGQPQSQPQTQPQGQPQGQSEAQAKLKAEAEKLKFSQDLAIVVNQVRPDKGPDFEAAWNEIKTKLSSSEKPELKQLGDSIKILKVDAAAAASGGSIVYLFYLDPPSKTMSYHPAAIVYESGAFSREEAEQIFGKLKDAYQGINPWPLEKVGGK